jgi:predicted transglutaminase-like cysteine proteinase
MRVRGRWGLALAMLVALGTPMARAQLPGKDVVAVAPTELRGNVSPDPADMLLIVNARFNGYVQASDEVLWGRREYWATPAEVVSRAAGDCEDLAIAKFFALLERGVPEERLRLVWLPQRRAIEGHMVLAYYPASGAEPLILDNVEHRILPLSRRTDLLALAAFNRTGWWSVRSGAAQFRGPVVPYPHWHEMMARHVGATQPGEAAPAAGQTSYSAIPR